MKWTKSKRQNLDFFGKNYKKIKNFIFLKISTDKVMFRKKLNLQHKIRIYDIINKYIKYEKYVNNFILILSEKRIKCQMNYKMVYTVYFTSCY